MKPTDAEPTSQPVTDTKLTPLLVSIEDAARVLAVGRSMLYELIAAGELETIHIGRCRRVPVDALRHFVEGRRVG